MDSKKIEHTLLELPMDYTVGRVPYYHALYVIVWLKIDELFKEL